ncbi:MAG: hypothetical protein V4803_22430 [Burkholderia gladioli]
MTTKSDLLAAALQGLAGQTAAGARVYGARDLSTWDDEYPVLFVSIPLDEDGESFGRNGAPAFTVSCSLIVEARASALARADDGGALDLVDQLETLRDQVKRAVINYGPLMSQIQQYAFFKVRGKPGPGEAGEHVGGVEIEIGLEFVQDASDFRLSDPPPLEGIGVTVAMPQGTVAPTFSIPFEQSIS